MQTLRSVQVSFNKALFLLMIEQTVQEEQPKDHIQIHKVVTNKQILSN